MRIAPYCFNMMVFRPHNMRWISIRYEPYFGLHYRTMLEIILRRAFLKMQNRRHLRHLGVTLAKPSSSCVAFSFVALLIDCNVQGIG